MSTLDPENNRSRALFEFADSTNKHSIEIGRDNGCKSSTHNIIRN